ncbi:TIGR04255 family protein [Methylobacterium sp. E-066]|uniref:TIGR04255 family protein n=1 Tax=Methylobacterium sp. E-066 TaxID=2836584 RepID=UPI001FB98531|nr:TIGR04255 family protein [Methylobacterium sp. E-066]MCJ2140258.1 TIGR04255 family protein [Methylobacterium sp. E-066]
MSRHYAKAPIAEAVIDVRSVPGPDVTAASFDELVHRLRSQFSVAAPIQNYQFGLAHEAGQAVQFHGAHAEIGRRLQTTEANRVLQLKVDGFTYSWLPPYSTWEEFRDEAKSLWSEYVKIAACSAINRVAIRTINKIELPPDPGVSLKKYFNLHPQVPDSINGISTFFMQIQTAMHDCTADARAIINFGGNAFSPETPPEVVLDLDVFVERVGFLEKDIWECLDGLRGCKNKLFESCITDEFRALIS